MLLLRREALSDHSLEREKGGEKIEPGRKDWLRQGLDDGANLEAFALFSLYMCVFKHTCRHIALVYV